jgi:hypothetical protein
VNTDAVQRQNVLKGIGKSYVHNNIGEKGVLFFINLKHSEGELALGLGRRSFQEKDDSKPGRYWIRWFVRKSRKDSWGVRPGFRLAKKHENPLSLENVQHFLPLQIQTTPACDADAPILTADCLTAARAMLSAMPARKSDEDEDEDEGEEDVEIEEGEGKEESDDGDTEDSDDGEECEVCDDDDDDESPDDESPDDESPDDESPDDESPDDKSSDEEDNSSADAHQSKAAKKFGQ